jgi:hypothetical protein
MNKKRPPINKERLEEIIERHKKLYKKLAEQEVCTGCGCTPCDCGWGIE